MESTMSITLNGSTGITSPAIDISTALTIADGGTGLTSTGAVGNALISDGTAWVSTPQLKIITDSTDITPALYSAGTAYTNVGSSFSINIPTFGLIKFSNLSGRVLNSAAATGHAIAFGIRIGTTNYWFGEFNNNGTITMAATTAQFAGSNIANAYYEFNGSGSSSGTGPAADRLISMMDITGAGIPTGIQTVQLIACSISTAPTLKGTVKQTRVVLEFIQG